MDVSKSLNKMPASKSVSHQLFTIHQLQLEELLTKPSYSVMGPIDMFGLLKSSLPRIMDSLDLAWMRSTHGLCTFFIAGVEIVIFDLNLKLFQLRY